jgi:DNA-directed RNA polymerase specialized sigma24 family protein
MSPEFIPSHDSLIPPQELPPGADAFARQMQSLLDGHPKEEAAVASAFEGLDDMFDRIAAGLYSLASMLVGEGEDGARLVETAISTAELSACSNPVQARQNSRRALSAAAIDILAQRHPGCLAAPEGLEPALTCIEDDDLDAAGGYGEELERMISGPDRDRVRTWLESLPTVLRTIFVLRAVAGFSASETTALLAAHGGPQAAGWTPDAVREEFRQGLCSLASQLLQATAAR